MTTQERAKEVFNLLAYQYKPLERKLRRKFPVSYTLYEEEDYQGKMRILDSLALRLTA